MDTSKVSIVMGSYKQNWSALYYLLQKQQV